jgi:hypothetical protein
MTAKMIHQRKKLTLPYFWPRLFGVPHPHIKHTLNFISPTTFCLPIFLAIIILAPVIIKKYHNFELAMCGRQLAPRSIYGCF